jgi:hypothetical protein
MIRGKAESATSAWASESLVSRVGLDIFVGLKEQQSFETSRALSQFQAKTVATNQPKV